MKIQIQRASNGFIVKELDAVDYEGNTIECKFVFEDTDDYSSDGEKEAFVKLAQYLSNYFSVQGTKHDKKRIDITYN